MIRLSGKHLLADQRAYALVCPATDESGETEHFGFAPKLADLLLSWKGWWKDMPAELLEEEIESACRADKTFDPDLQRQRIRTQGVKVAMTGKIVTCPHYKTVQSCVDSNLVEFHPIRILVVQSPSSHRPERGLRRE